MFSIKREAHHSNYTCIANALIRDERLTFELTGFLLRVLSLPDDWRFSVSGMAKICCASAYKVRRYLARLEELGYLRREQQKQADGRFGETCFYFFEQPLSKIPSTDAPRADEPCAEDCAQPNTHIPNTKEEQNTKSTNAAEESDERRSAVEKQIGADALSKEYGSERIDAVVRVIAGALGAKRRTYSGISVDGEELKRVFGAVDSSDVRGALEAIRGRRFASFAAYFGAVLFSRVRDRLASGAVQASGRSGAGGSGDAGGSGGAVRTFEVDEVMAEILQFYQ